MRVWRGIAVALCLVAGSAQAVLSEVVRVVIDRRTVFLGGRVFGAAGTYELLEGRIFFAFDPEDPANAGITDLHLAPVGEDGRVELWTGFTVLQPVDPQQRRGIAWVDLGDDGVGATAAAIHGGDPWAAVFADEGDIGDPLLLREGVTWIQLGWEAALAEGPGQLTLAVPTAVAADGSPVVGWVRLDWLVRDDDEPLSLVDPRRPLSPVVVPEAPVHVLTVRDEPESVRDTIPADAWSFVLAEDGPYAGTPVSLEIDGGTEAGRIYELVYRARDPRVVGLGFAVVRDVMSYARYDLDSAFPTGSGIAFGAGAGGRFLRQFVHEGFNVDEGGRPVFDVVWAHGAGAARGQFNARFAQPGRVPFRSEDHGHPVDLFPFTTSSQFDPVTGRNEGLLPDPGDTGRPRSVMTHRAHDYWGRGAALTHTSVDGLRDVVPDGADRAYHLASTLPDEGGSAPDGPETRWTLRALAVAMLDWVDGDVAPPPSRVPTVGEGTLVPAAAVAYPSVDAIPGPPIPHLVSRLDHGNRFVEQGVMDREPPELGPAFPVGVPQVDGLGNELGGIRGLEVRVPVATFLPWAPPEDGAGPGRVGQGAVVPLSLTDAEAEARGDGRPSLQRLYGSEAAFLARVRAAAAALVADGFLLEEDREAAISRARERWLAVVGGG